MSRSAASIPQPWRTVYGRQGWMASIADRLIDTMAGKAAERPSDQPEFRASDKVRYRFLTAAAWYWHLYSNPISSVLRNQHRERVVRLGVAQHEVGWWSADRGASSQGAGESEASFLLLSSIAMLRGGLMFGHDDVVEAWASVLSGCLRFWDKVATEDGEIVMPCLGSTYPFSFATTTCYRLLRGLQLKGYTGRPIAEWPDLWDQERHLAGARVLRDILRGFNREQLLGKDDQLTELPLQVPMVVIRKPGTIYARLAKAPDDDTTYDPAKTISETAVRIVRPGQHEIVYTQGWERNNSLWPEWATVAADSVNGQFVTYDSRRD